MTVPLICALNAPVKRPFLFLWKGFTYLMDKSNYEKTEANNNFPIKLYDNINSDFLVIFNFVLST